MPHRPLTHHLFVVGAPEVCVASAESHPGIETAMRAIGDEGEHDTVDYAVVNLRDEFSDGQPTVDVYRWRRGLGPPRPVGYVWPKETQARYIATARVHEGDERPSDVTITTPARAHQPSPPANPSAGGSDTSPPIPDGAGGGLRMLYVTDAATRIPALVVIPHRLGGEARRVAWSAGYDPDTAYALVTDLTSMETQSDPFAWTNATMGAFHRLLLEGATTRGLCSLNALTAMPDGTEVNVELYRRRVVNREDV